MISSCVVFLASTSPASLPPLMTRILSHTPSKMCIRDRIVGLAGLDGSGRTETLENIFGVATRKDGVIKLDGKEVRNRNARESIKNGFALLTEERRATGIFGILNIRENTVISSLKKHKKAGFYLSDKSMEKDTAWAIDAMHIKTPSQKTKIRSLSGGNQQKVILGRWLLTEPDVYKRQG